MRHENYRGFEMRREDDCIAVYQGETLQGEFDSKLDARDYIDYVCQYDTAEEDYHNEMFQIDASITGYGDVY